MNTHREEKTLALAETPDNFSESIETICRKTLRVTIGKDNRRRAVSLLVGSKTTIDWLQCPRRERRTVELTITYGGTRSPDRHFARRRTNVDV